MTQTAAVIGTAQYLSPEQARGETVDARSDLYSAGCLLYELLVGRPPFVGDSPVSVAYQHVREAPVPPSQLDPEITPEIDAVVLKALAKDPADRYQSAKEMKADISRLLSGEQTAAQQTTAVVAMAAGAMAANAYDTPTHLATPPPVGPPEGSEEEYEEEEPQKSRVGLAILIGALIVLALGLGGWGLYRMFNPANPPVEKVAVPGVTGFNEQQARDQLTAAKLQVNVEKVNGDEGTQGTVTAQEPVGGTEVAVDSTVTITVNEGPKTGTIPDNLVGQDVKEVKNDLDDLKFTNVTTKAAKSEDPDTKPGEVTSISPKEGETVPLDSKITVRYATGKSEVPNFDGLSRSAAIRQARDAGFDDPVFAQRESSKPGGTVIGQSPRAGATVDRDTTIRLTLAVQSPPPTNPPTTNPPTTKPPTEPPTTSPPTQTPTPSKEKKTPSDSNT
jgi:serine/threonine-protein kinase